MINTSYVSCFLQANPLVSMEAFQKFNKNEMELAITFFKAPELDQALQEKIMDLMKMNMQTVYAYLLLMLFGS